MEEPMDELPKPFKLLVTVLSGAVLVCSVGAAILAAQQRGWTMVGFEVVVIVAAALGLLIGLARLSGSTAVGLVCAAGTIAAGSFVSDMTVQHRLAGHALWPLLAGRIAVATVLLVLAITAVLNGNPRKAWPAFIKGAVLGLPPFGLALLIALPRGRKLLAGFDGLGDFAKMAVVLIGFAVFTACLAASVQFIIAALELGSAGNPPARSHPRRAT
jgi:hypothetical protein